MKCVAGIGNVEMSDADHAARVAEEKVWSDAAPARAFDALRTERNEMLVETDFYANSDVTMSDEMKAYRKALRDLPASYDNSSILSFDFDSSWPEKP